MRKQKISVVIMLVLIGVFTTAFSLLAATTGSLAQNENTTAKTLGKLILQEKGRVVVERLISVTDMLGTIEHTSSQSGTLNDTTSVTDIGTATNIIADIGQIEQGKGQGLLRTSDGSMAVYVERYAGSPDIPGNKNIQGTMNFTSLATGRLASLHNATLAFRLQINPAGDTMLKAWQLE
jgi:hypothetical protein